MIALRDFNHLGTSVTAGEEVSDDLFEAADLQGLVNKGLIGDENNEVPAPSSAMRRRSRVAESHAHGANNAPGQAERSTLKKGTKK